MSAKTRRNHKSWSKRGHTRLRLARSEKQGGRVHYKYRVISRAAYPPRRRLKYGEGA